MISKIVHFMEIGIWEIWLRDPSTFKGFLIRCLQALLLSLREFMKNGEQRRASVLTYYSLLNLYRDICIVKKAF